MICGVRSSQLPLTVATGHGVLLPTPRRLAFNPPAENVNNPLAAWHHPFDAACLGSDYVRNQMGANIDVM